MSPLWIEEDDGTCSSPPFRVSSLSGTTSKVCWVSLGPALAFIWSAAGAISGLVCTPCAPLFPFSSSSTQEPWQHKGQVKGGKEGRKWKLHHIETHPCLLFNPNSWPTFACTTDTVHSNELAVRCIRYSTHFFVPLPHKQLALFFFFAHRRRLCNLLRASLVSTEYKPYNRRAHPFLCRK